MGDDNSNGYFQLYLIQELENEQTEFYKINSILDIASISDMLRYNKKDKFYSMITNGSEKYFSRLSLDKPKSKKKSLKKWLMSKGYSRDESETVVDFVSKIHLPYAYMYYYILMDGIRNEQQQTR